MCCCMLFGVVIIVGVLLGFCCVCYSVGFCCEYLLCELGMCYLVWVVALLCGLSGRGGCGGWVELFSCRLVVWVVSGGCGWFCVVLVGWMWVGWMWVGWVWGLAGCGLAGWLLTGCGGWVFTGP